MIRLLFTACLSVWVGSALLSVLFTASCLVFSGKANIKKNKDIKKEYNKDFRELLEYTRSNITMIFVKILKMEIGKQGKSSKRSPNSGDINLKLAC